MISIAAIALFVCFASFVALCVLLLDGVLEQDDQ